MIQGVAPWAELTSDTAITLDLEQAYGDFIDDYGKGAGGWNWWVTLTFRDELHDEVTDKRFRRFIHTLNREIFGQRYYKAGLGVAWVRGKETLKSRRVCHYHCLIAGVPESVDRNQYWKDWAWHNGINRIEPYDGTKGARYYLSKYAAKGGEIDFDNGCSFTRDVFPKKPASM